MQQHGHPYAGRPGPWAGGRLDVEGHRGARGLAPENTVPSFRAAIEAGVTGVELDVQLTADGKVVVWHDPTLQADKCVCEGADLLGAWVGGLTLAQLRTVDVGARVLPAYPRQRAVPGTRMVTLPELLVEFSDAAELWWTIEVKTDATDPSANINHHSFYLYAQQPEVQARLGFTKTPPVLTRPFPKLRYEPQS